MQPRRTQDFTELVSPSKRRAPVRNDMSSDRHSTVLSDSDGVLDGSPHNPRRGLPNRMDQHWHSSSRGSEQFLSHGISSHIRKRPRDDVDVRCSVCEFCEPGQRYHVGANTRLKHVHHPNERNVGTGRMAPFTHEYGRSGGKFMVIEYGEIPTPYCEICANGPLPSKDASRCLEHLKRPVTVDTYKGRQDILHPRENSVAVNPRSHPREFADYSNSNIRRVSSSNMRGAIVDSYGADEPLPPTDEYIDEERPSKNANATTYCKRVLIDSARNPGMGPKNPSHHSHFRQSGGYHTPPDECEEYHYIKHQNIVKESCGYPSKDLHELMPPYAQHHYRHAQGKDRFVDFSGPYKRRSALERLEVVEDFGNSRESSIWNRTSLKKRTAQKSSHALDASQQSGTFPVSGYVHADCERQPVQDRKAVRLSSRMDSMSHLKPINRFERDNSLGASKQTYHRTENHHYDRKIHGLPARSQRMEELEEEMEDEEGGTFIGSERIHRSKHGKEQYFFEDEYTSTMLRKYKTLDYEDLDGSERTNYEENRGDMWFANSPSDEQEMGEVTYRRQIFQQDFASDSRSPLQNNLEHDELQPGWFSRQQAKSLKGYYKSGPAGWHNKSQYHIGRKSGFPRYQKAEKRNDVEFHDDDLTNEYEQSEDQENHEEVELHEESDEFKQLAHEAFLDYSKKININSAVQRRYQAQGKAGSLFCIACGRRFSKEFQDTERLVKHAFMAQRPWLRAKHLGLHRAICVLLGWRSFTPEDNPTSSPRVLPKSEALAQKEDLIIWPPVVVIHNLSMVTDSPEDQKVVPIERVKAFLRGKGLADGKMVICLGKPADQSVMVVKFLGTFSGLGNALKMHEYFAENKHGRAELQEMASAPSRGKRGSTESAGLLVGKDELEELNLYGYLGIAEDLDEVDFKTRKVCLIKSKKEINDFANAPVKAE